MFKLRAVSRVLIFILIILLANVGLTMDFSLNGFGSGYYLQALNTGLYTSPSRDSNINFTNYSLMGLNLAANIDNNLNFAAQLVALGTPYSTSDNFGVSAQWAYANFNPTDDYSLKIGRQLFPLFLASEVVRVGFLAPYVTSPVLVSGIAPFSRFDGISLNQSIENSLGILTLGLFAGTPLIDVNTNLLKTAMTTTTISIANLVGGHMDLDGDGWRFRVMAAKLKSSLNTTLNGPPETPYLIQEANNTQFFTVGYRYDRGQFMSWGECLIEQSPDGSEGSGTAIGPTGGRYGTYDSGCYVLLGYHFGKFIPRYTFAQQNENLNTPSFSAPGQYANGQAYSHNFGLNYQLATKAVIKFEYQRLTLRSLDDDISSVIRTQGAKETYSDSILAGIDYVF